MLVKLCALRYYVAMRKSRNPAKVERFETLSTWMRKMRLNEDECVLWLWDRGVGITPQHLSDVLERRKAAGPVMVRLFKSVTGVTLVEKLNNERPAGQRG